MSELDRAIEEASQLPLLDAAYVLWKQHMELDRLEHPARPSMPRPDLKNPEVLGRTVREALAKVHNDRATAHDGPTFDRLTRAHPEATNLEAKNAIRAAVKFDGDCSTYFSPASANYADDVTRAVERAKADNPGFQDSTYQRAWHDLATAMR